MKQAAIASFIFITCFTTLYAQPLKQQQVFTHADTLRGTYGPARSWWDALEYDIGVKFNFRDSTISGSNRIFFKRLKKGNNLMQIDLQEPLIVDSIVATKVNIAPHPSLDSRNNPALRFTNTQVPFTKDGNAYFADLSQLFKKEKNANNITVYYHGKPRIAKRPPWDGGLIWKKDKLGRPWATIACQGLGASVWYPCKDHQADEPDAATMLITVPDTLMAVANGRMYGSRNNNNGTMTYAWEVQNPINNYNLIPYIGKYVNFSEVYKGEKGDLDMSYWVMDYNLEKAKKQFADAPRMMKAFEYWFGPYPFYEDGYKLVEAPHLGMEHQSAVAYGNGYQNGYSGRDLSGSGWGMKWDFIIVHESGHEWFANNITSKDIADMWIHESFTNYSETLFTDYYYGKEAGNDYVIGTRKNIANDIPVIGPYGVNQEGSGDMYYKGGNMLHMIRQVIDNDEKFRAVLRGLNKKFYHKTVTTQEVESYISKESRKDLSKIFDQYLRTTQIPVLEYKIDGYNVSYRWDSCVAGFNMPVKVYLGKADKTSQWIYPGTNWQTLSLADWYNKMTFIADKNFYIKTKKVD